MEQVIVCKNTYEKEVPPHPPALNIHDYIQMRVQNQVIVLQCQQSLFESYHSAKKEMVRQKCILNFKTNHTKRVKIEAFTYFQHKEKFDSGRHEVTSQNNFFEGANIRIFKNELFRRREECFRVKWIFLFFFVYLKL